MINLKQETEEMGQHRDESDNKAILAVTAQHLRRRDSEETRKGGHPCGELTLNCGSLRDNNICLCDDNDLSCLHKHDKARPT